MRDQNNTDTKDYGMKKLELVNFWISNIDNKISFILAFVGVFVGFLISKGTPNVIKYISNIPIKDIATLNMGQIVSMFLLFTMYLSSISCIILLLLALLGRVNSKIYKEYKLTTNSLIFFGSISKMNYSNYKEKCKKENDKQLLNDINSQIYINSKICDYKFKLYNYSIKLLIISFITFCICGLFTVI